MKELPAKLVVFDGDCGLCNFCVKMIIRFDKKNEFFITPLAGPVGQTLLESRGIKEDAALYVRDGRVYGGADCVIECLYDLGGLPKTLSFFLKLFPKTLRDFVYKKIGKYRYFLFGKPKIKVCNMLDDEIVKRLI